MNIPYKYLAIGLIVSSACLADAKDVERKYTNAPAATQFIHNAGQVTDQHGKLRSDIDFKIEHGGFTMFGGNGQLHYQWTKQSQKSEVESQTDNTVFPFRGDRGADSRQTPSDVEIYRMDVTLVGANTNAQVVFEEPTGYYENYYLAHTGEYGAVAKGYNKVTYKNVYPGVDWVIYTPPAPLKGSDGSQGVKYDFVVHPGGNPADIRLRYDGATELKLVDGTLVAVTPYGTITEAAPYSYNATTKTIVTSKYILQGNELRFDVRQYEGTLVIDPALHWATYYGGNSLDYNNSICTDSLDYVYVTGGTGSSNNIATTGAYQTTLTGNGNYTGFVAKFDMDGRRIWSTYYGKGIRTTFLNIAFGNGSIYVVGECDSANVTMSTGTQQQTYGGGTSDCILLKFNASGGFIWSTYYGGTGRDQAFSLAIDGAGDLVVRGETNSPNNIATTGAYITSLPNTTESYFFAKFNVNGVRLWCTYFGAVNRTWLNDITPDRWSNIYIVGYTSDTAGIATQGTHKQTIGTNRDAYLMKFSSSGAKIWGTYYGGSTNGDYFEGVTCDSAGYVYAVGATQSNDSIATTGAFKTTITSTIGDAMMVKFDSSGKRVWGTYYGGNSTETFLDILYIGKGVLYAAGNTGSTSGIATSDGSITSPQGGVDAFFVKFDTAGNRLWGTYFGGSAYDHPGFNNSITSTKNNDVFFCGYGRSTSGMSTANGHQPTFGGGDTDGYLVKFTGDTVVSVNKPLPDTICAGSGLYIAYRTTYPFKSNNSFLVQLSDTTGSFASAVTIGTKAGISTDSIYCTIPINTIPGTRYRIRIIGTQKADTSLENINDITITNVYPGNLSAVGNSPVCPYDSLKLSATSTTTGVQFVWSGPGGFTSNTANAHVDSAARSGAGLYILTAMYRGCVGKDTVNVALKPMPYSGVMAAQANAACQGDTLFFTTPTGLTGTTYSWAGPNSFAAGVQNPFINNFSTSHLGSYFITATLNGCYQKDTVNVSVVKPLPAKPVASSNAPICSGTNLQFSVSSSTSGVTYSWVGPNSFNSTSATPVILAASPVHNGDYIATAILNGCRSFDTVTAIVNPIPVKPVLSSNNPVCAGDSVRISATSSTNGVTYAWSGPGSFSGVSADTSILASASYSGVFTATVSKDGCNNFDTIHVLVKPLPTAVTTGSNSPLCAGSNLQFTVSNSTTGSTYAWAGPNSFTAGIQNTSISNSTVAASGWYIATVNLNGCTIKDSVFATVNAVPATPVVSYNNPLCAGQALNLSATTNISGATYSWTGIGGYTANTQNPTRANMQFGDTGLYNVTATVNGCTSPVGAVRVGINPTPFVVIFANPADSICAGSPLVFTALPNNHGGTPMYQWYVNNAAVSTGNIFNTTALANGDVVRCDMTESTKCSIPYTDASNDINMNVLPWLAPSVSFTANPNRPLEVNEYVTFTATSINAGASPTYQWKRNGQNVQGATGSVWSANTLNDNDDICVEVISSYKCPQPLTALSSCIKVKVLSGIGDVVNSSSIKVYPNPVKGTLRITSTTTIETITINNLLGQQLMQQTAKGNNAEVDMSGLAAGVYVVKVNGSYAVRVVKE